MRHRRTHGRTVHPVLRAITLALAAALSVGLLQPVAWADTATNLPAPECVQAGTDPSPDGGTGDDSAEPDTGGSASQLTIACGDDPALAAAGVKATAGDVVISLTVDGVDQESAQKALEGLPDPAEPLSDRIRSVLERDAVQMPENALAGWTDFDGTVQATTGGLAVVIPTAEVSAAFSWKILIPPVVGWLAGALAFAGCDAAMVGPAAVFAPAVCGAIRGAVMAFVTSILMSKLNGKQLTDANPWLEAFALGVVGGITGGVWDGFLKEWIKTGLTPLLRTLGQAVGQLSVRIASWAGSTVASGVKWIGEQLMVFAEVLVPKIQEIAGRLGWNASAVRPSQVRLMPLGDSITYGVGSSTGAGYRELLWKDLAGDVPAVDFVGTQRAGAFADPDNEGHSGWRIDQISGAAACAVPRYRPNVVTLHAGTNDMNQAYDLANAPRRLGALIDQVQASAPEATVLVATLVPATKDGLQPRIDAYNAALPAIVEQRQARGRHVELVDMGHVTTADLSQPAHPGDSGYAKMASAFYFGILRAMAKGWITDPVGGTGQDCTGEDPEQESKAGPGWQSLGVIAPGMSTPEGRTDLVELNGDDRADYVRIAADGSVRAALNTVGEPGKPDWVDQGMIITRNFPDSITGDKVRFADLNGDNIDDYLLVQDDGSVAVHWRYPNSSYLGYGGIEAPIAGGASREAIRFADINGDGRDDYLRVGANGAIHAYVNTRAANGGIQWEERLNWAPGVWYGTRDKLRMADVNGDRKADYLMVGSNGQVHAYLNDGGAGAGGFTEHLSFVNPTDHPGEKSTFRDISGDGKADYVVIYDGGAVRCWLNRGGNIGGI